MSQIISDFFHLGVLRTIARVLMSIRGLLIISYLTPRDLGEYTIWLLFIFYFSILDFGILNGLERDLPHYRGKNDFNAAQSFLNTGLSGYSLLVSIAVVMLYFSIVFFFGDWVLGMLLALNLLTDKFYRAYESFSRIELKYKDNGISQLISGGISLFLVWVLMPVWGIKGILLAFPVGSLCAGVYLALRIKLPVQFNFDLKKVFDYTKSAFSLALFVYSMESFHMISLTVLAYVLDKETLGYYAFAFRIFQILLVVFPYLIQEVMRTRLYFQTAQTSASQNDFNYFFIPMSLYSVVVTLCICGGFWWGLWIVNKFFPVYVSSVEGINILIIALVPLGILKICSDYLCSRAVNKTKIVIGAWVAGILLQLILILTQQITETTVIYQVPMIYLLSTFLIYIFITLEAFKLKNDIKNALMRSVIFVIPLALLIAIYYFLKNSMGWIPSAIFVKNVIPFFMNAGALGIILLGLYQWPFLKKRLQSNVTGS